MDKVTGQCPKTTTFLKRKESRSVSNRGPSAYQPTALPLGQTGSRFSTPLSFPDIICKFAAVTSATRVDTPVHPSCLAGDGPPSDDDHLRR